MAQLNSIIQVKLSFSQKLHFISQTQCTKLLHVERLDGCIKSPTHLFSRVRGKTLTHSTIVLKFCLSPTAYSSVAHRIFFSIPFHIRSVSIKLTLATIDLLQHEERLPVVSGTSCCLQ